MSQAWLKVVVPASDAEVAALEDALVERGALSVSVAARDDLTPRFHTPGEPEPTLWARCEVEALFEMGIDGHALLAELQRAGFEAAGARHEILADEDWQQRFRQQFTPMRFAGDLWVVPSWHAAPSEARHVIKLDPGMAFGTGTHPTTALCLDWLGDSAGVAGATVLDYGCGSGILAIAAARLGAATVTGLDIDPDACAVARENAGANGCPTIEFILPGALLPGGRFDVLVANILLNPLLALAGDLASRVVPGGRIGLSGILAEQLPELAQAYAPWFELDPPRQREEWAFLAGKRRSEVGAC